MYATGIVTITMRRCEIIINYGSRYETVFILNSTIEVPMGGWTSERKKITRKFHFSRFFDDCIKKINQAFFIGNDAKVSKIIFAGCHDIHTEFKEYELLPPRIYNLIGEVLTPRTSGVSVMELLIKYNLIEPTEEDNSMQPLQRLKAMLE
jgi:peptide subunit release factor 1 (eRF1)